MNPISGDMNVVNHLLFGGASQAMNHLIESNSFQVLQSIGSNWGSKMIEKTQELFNNYQGGEVKRLVQAAVNKMTAITKPNVISELRTLEDFQTAKSVMQSYVMAEPYTRSLYHRQLCDGYSDEYVDPNPGVIGLGHRAYEHVMDGVMFGTPRQYNGSVLGSKAPQEDDLDITRVNYTGAYNEDGHLALSITEKATILNTWRFLRNHFDAQDEDPVNPWGGSL